MSSDPRATRLHHRRHVLPHHTSHRAFPLSICRRVSLDFFLSKISRLSAEPRNSLSNGELLTKEVAIENCDQSGDNELCGEIRGRLFIATYYRAQGAMGREGKKGGNTRAPILSWISRSVRARRSRPASAASTVSTVDGDSGGGGGGGAGGGGPGSERQRLARGCISGGGGGGDDGGGGGCRLEQVDHSAKRLTTLPPSSGEVARRRDTRTSTCRSP